VKNKIKIKDYVIINPVSKLLTKLSTKIFRSTVLITVITILSSGVYAQQNGAPDSTITAGQKPKPEKKKKKSFILESKIERKANDSVIVNYAKQKAYLYGNAVVKYENITLKAAYIEIDFTENTVYAVGKPDSNGVIQGTPVFKEGKDEYETRELKYNFNTRKGLVYNVTKQEGDAYVFLKEGKKMPDNVTFVQTGHFTTCSLPHPHYRIRYGKGKIIPDDKIVTGPIYMEIEDIPIPLVLPFGFFPNKKGRANGILIPSYGYYENRGYYLSNGGYYMGLGEHMDLAIRGDIYSKGSWALRTLTNYNYRYRSRGSVSLEFAKNKMGETDTKNYTEDQSFFIRWRHTQDPKANPNSNFSANVNFGSTQHNKLNSINTNDYLRNTFSSSIAYSTKIKQSNLSININHNQNTQTHLMNIDLPIISFNTPRINPFQRKVQVGSRKWYEKISFTYSMNAKNQLSTPDTLFFKSQFSDFRNGISQRIPISVTVPVGHLNWTNSATINEYWYFNTINKYYDPDLITGGNDTGGVVTEEVPGFRAGHDFSYSSNFSTRIYGMFTPLFGPVKAIRHVMTPTVGFTYHPDMDKLFNYYQEYTDKKGDTIRYSVFDNGIYGGPGYGKAGAVTLNIGNTLEAKVRSKKDTVTGMKKIKIIEGFNISTAYNLAAEEFQLAPLSVSARTTVFKKIHIQFNGIWDFYAVDTTGKRINKFNWEVNNRIFRKNNTVWNFSFDYSISANELKNKGKKSEYKSDKGTPEELQQLNMYPDRYVDFNNQWSLNIGYSLRYTDAFRVENKKVTYDKTYVQTLNLRGDVNITEKWKVGFTTGYDFRAKDLSFTSFDIYRDLHCWELMFNWIPIGPRRSYNLTIRVKSPLLQDLKINKKRDWRDF